MSDDGAQLASVATALDELTDRITRLAEAFSSSDDAQTSSELYEIERTLQQAARRLERLVREA
jgi:aspartokinase